MAMTLDHQLIDEFYKCDNAAIESLHRRWWPVVTALIQHKGVRGADVDGLATDVMTCAFLTKFELHRKRYNPARGPFLTWVRTCVRYKVLKHRFPDRRRPDELTYDPAGPSSSEELPISNICIAEVLGPTAVPEQVPGRLAAMLADPNVETKKVACKAVGALGQAVVHEEAVKARIVQELRAIQTAIKDEVLIALASWALTMLEAPCSKELNDDEKYFVACLQELPRQQRAFMLLWKGKSVGDEELGLGTLRQTEIAPVLGIKDPAVAAIKKDALPALVACMTKKRESAGGPCAL
jgi:DNA-directed RNA polymerase specialized sigma24 family protein